MVTNEDLEKAHQIYGYGPSTPRTYTSIEYTRIHETAAALADEREKARAPFLALAEEFAENPHGDWTAGDVANEIRRVAEEG